MDVQSGDILALASSPTINPNDSVQGLSAAEAKRRQDPFLSPEGIDGDHRMPNECEPNLKRHKSESESSISQGQSGYLGGCKNESDCAPQVEDGIGSQNNEHVSNIEGTVFQFLFVVTMIASSHREAPENP